MANNDTDVTVGIGAKGEYQSVISGAIGDFKKFWLTAQGGAGAEMAAGNMEKLANKMGVSSKALLGVGIAGGVAAAGAVAIGVSAAKAATNFQELTTQLITGAGESEKNIDMIREGILKVSNATGESADALAQGMFMIESAGYRGKQGLDVLTASAEGAKVGGTDLNSMTSAVTTVMHNYASANISASQATNFLVSSMQNGKMHLQDLTDNLGKILPTASQLHVPLEQTGAALATLTNAGVPAARAATALNQTMLQLVHPSGAAQKALEEVGLSSQEVGNVMTKQGLQQALQTITEHIGKKFPAGSAEYMNALASITGGTKGLTGALGTTGQNMQTFIDNSRKIADATHHAGKAVIGWSEVQKDEKTKMDQAKASIQNAKIALGEGLLPMVTAITQAIVKVVTPIAEWIDKHKKLASEILGGVAAFGAFVATTLTAVKVFHLIKDAIMAVRVAMIFLSETFLLNPIGLAIMVIVGLTILLITHWNTVKKWFSEFWGWIKNVFHDIVYFIKGHWEMLASILLGPIGAIIGAWGAFHRQIIAGFDAAISWIKSIWSSLIGHIGSVISGIAGAISGAASSFRHLLVDAGSWLIDGLVNGVEGAASKVFDTIKGIGSKAVGALKGVLKIFSPSQVFAELGGYIGQGLVQGIQGTEQNVTSATSKLGTAAIVGGQSSVSGSSITNNSSTSHNNNQSVTLHNPNFQLMMPNGATMQTFMQSLSQDQLNVSKGLTPVRGAY